MLQTTNIAKRPFIPDARLDSLDTLFGDRATNHARPLPSRKQSIQVLTGIYSFDPAFLAFTRELADELDAHIPVDVDERGFVGQTGIHNDFQTLKTVAGYSQNPMGYVPLDNRLMRTQSSLPNDYRSRDHEALAREFFHLVLGSLVPAPVRATKYSSSGFATFSSDFEWKLDLTRYMLSRHDDIRKLVTARDHDGMLRGYDLFPSYYCNKRLQTERKEKKRLVADLDYATSGGKKGSMSVANKDVVIDGTRYDEHTAARARIVQGGNWSMNALLQIGASGAQYAMYELWPRTFHHTDADSTAEDISSFGNDMIATDITQYDHTWPDFLMKTFIEVMREYWDEWYVDLFEMSQYVGYYTRPLDVDGKRGTFVGPILPDTTLAPGNRSGNAWTSVLAKIGMVWDSLTICHDVIAPLTGKVNDFLSWRWMAAVKNGGDDQITAGSTQVVSLYRAAILAEPVNGVKKHGYFEAKEEVGQVFLGNAFSRAPRTDDRGGHSFTSMRRIHTMFEKTFCPERSINGIFRQYWPLGIFDRLTLNARHPAYGEAMSIMNSCWRRHLQQQHGSFVGIATQALADMGVPSEALTDIDAAVLIDPKRLHYQFKPEEISQGVLDIISAAISKEEVQPFIKEYYHGKTIEKQEYHAG